MNQWKNNPSETSDSSTLHIRRQNTLITVVWEFVHSGQLFSSSGFRPCPSSVRRNTPLRRWCTSAARTKGRRGGSASTASCPTPTTAPSRATPLQPCLRSQDSASTQMFARDDGRRILQSRTLSTELTPFHISCFCFRHTISA